MQTHAILCKKDLISNLIHTKYYITDSRITVVVFWNFLENAEGYNNFLDDQQAEQILNSVELNDVDFTQVFKSSQLGISKENSFWKISDKKTLDLNNLYFSTAEIEGPVMWSMILNYQGKIYGPYNKFVETVNRKSWTIRDAEINSGVVLLTALSYKNSPKTFSEYRVALSYPKLTYFDCNIPATDISNWTFDQRTSDYNSYFPIIKLSGDNKIGRAHV